MVAALAREVSAAECTVLSARTDKVSALKLGVVALGTGVMSAIKSGVDSVVAHVMSAALHIVGSGCAGVVSAIELHMNAYLAGVMPTNKEHMITDLYVLVADRAVFYLREYAITVNSRAEEVSAIGAQLMSAVFAASVSALKLGVITGTHCAVTSFAILVILAVAFTLTAEIAIFVRQAVTSCDITAEITVVIFVLIRTDDTGKASAIKLSMRSGVTGKMSALESGVLFAITDIVVAAFTELV